jgi:phenylpropionate dioxygenase-like ring-hydroxylating dioxygenase large terminal subunit
MAFGTPLVLVRGPSGAPWAFEDRCAHRGVSLSGGRLTAAGLTCPYHGWSYGADGACTAIPGYTDVPPAAIRVAAFAVHEHGGLIWVSATSHQPLPQRITVLGASTRRFLWQARWQASALRIQENFLDALHTHSVHPGLVRRSDRRRRTEVTLRTEGDGFRVEYFGQTDQSGLIFRLFESARTHERAYCSDLAVTQLEYRYAAQRIVWITLCCTPETEHSTHLFGTLHIEGHWAPSWLIRGLLWPFIRRVAHQDQAIVECQERQHQDFPGRPDLVMPFDIVRPYLDRQWGTGSRSLPDCASFVLEL